MPASACFTGSHHISRCVYSIHELKSTGSVHCRKMELEYSQVWESFCLCFHFFPKDIYIYIYVQWLVAQLCSGLPCPPPEDLPNPGINLPNLGLPHLPSEPPGKGILLGQILKLTRTRNSFLCLFHFLLSRIGMSITITICLSHHCIYILIYRERCGPFLKSLLNLLQYCF